MRRIAFVLALGVSVGARVGASEAAKRYAEAVALEARVADSVSSLRRVLDYTQEFGLAVGEGQQRLARYEEALAWAREALEADRDLPAFESFDYEAIDQNLRRAAVECAADLASWAAKLRLKLGVPFDPLLEEGLIDPAIVAAPLEYGLAIGAKPGRADGALAVCLEGSDWDVIRTLGMEILSPDPTLFGARKLWPEPQRFDFGALDSVLKENADHGFRTEVRLGALSDIPDWLRSRFEGTDSLAVGPDGAVSDEPDIFHPVARQRLLEYAGAVAKHCAGNPYVARYVIFDPPDLARAGYSEAARQTFREWLKRRHGSIDVLNERWNSRYVNWEDIEPPATLASLHARPQDALLGEFARFKCDAMWGFLSEAAGVLRSSDPNCPLVARFAPSANFGVDLGLRGLDMERLAQGPWDGLGISSLGGGLPMALSRWLSLAAYRKGAKVLRASPFDWLSDGSRARFAQRPAPNRQRELRALAASNLWLELSWTRRGIDLGSLGVEGPRQGHAGLTASASGLQGEGKGTASAPPGAAVRYAAGVFPLIAQQWKQIAPVLAQARPADSGFAVLVAESTLAIERGPVGLDSGEGAPDLTSAVVQALLEDGFAPAWISENALAEGKEDLSAIRLIICPATTCLRSEARARLLEWANGGGELLCLGPFGLFDEYGASASERPAMAALGVAKPALDASGRWTDNGKERREFKSAVFGRGQILMRLTHTPAESAVLLQRCLREASPFRLASADFKRVACAVWDASDGARAIFIVNRSPEQSQKTTVSVLGRYSMALDLLAKGVPVPSSYQGGWTSLAVALEPGQGLVFRLQPWREKTADAAGE